MPILKTQPEDPSKILSGTSFTLMCSSEIFTNDTLTYSFFKDEQELVQNGTDGTFVIDQTSTNSIGNYTCQSKRNTLVKTSGTVFANGKHPISVVIS